MSFRNRQYCVAATPAPRPETVVDLYTQVLEAPPFSQLANAQAYFIGKNPDKPQALVFARRLANDPEPAMRWAGAAALAKLHIDGLREAERSLRLLVEDPHSQVRKAVAHELRFESSPETGRILQAIAKDPSPMVREAAGPVDKRHTKSWFHHYCRQH